MNELELKVIWKNGESFEMRCKGDDGDWTTVVRVEENGEIASLWPHIQQTCITYLTMKLRTIGNQMKEV